MERGFLLGSDKKRLKVVKDTGTRFWGVRRGVTPTTFLKSRPVEEQQQQPDNRNNHHYNDNNDNDFLNLVRRPVPAPPTQPGEEPMPSRPGRVHGKGDAIFRNVPMEALKHFYKREKGFNFDTVDNNGATDDDMEKNYGIQTHILTWRKGPPHQPRFTSIFLDPLSGEAFRSGRWSDPNVTKYESTQNNVDGVYWYWYPKKKDAQHGAAARAHDCLRYRLTANDNEPYWFIGDDIPYRAPAGDLQKKDYDAMKKACQHDDHIIEMMDSSDRPTGALATSQNVVPKELLQQWYTVNHRRRIPIRNDYFVTWEKSSCGGLFTSCFVCPFTGEFFFSRRYGEEDENYVHLVDNNDGYVWFKDRKFAEQAAAARAFDVLQAREGAELTIPRLCNDEPYHLNDQSDEMLTGDLPEEVEEKIYILKSCALSRQLRTQGIKKDDNMEDVDYVHPPEAIFSEEGKQEPIRALMHRYQTSRDPLNLTSTSYIVDEAESDLQGSRIFSCYFVCPILGEVFPSGAHAGKLRPVSKKGDAYFYRKKVSAKEAAAIRAYDVLEYRKHLEEGGTYFYMGKDKPYESGERTLNCMPSEEADAFIQKAQAESLQGLSPTRF